VAGLIYAVAQPIQDQASTFRRDLPERVDRLKTYPLIGKPLKDTDLRAETNRFFDELPERLTRNRDLVVGVAQTALTVLVLTLTTIVIMVFMTLNGPQIVAGFDGLFLDMEHRARARRIGRGVQDAVAGYVLGNLIISVCAALITVISLEIMRAPFPLVLALVMFLLDLVPMVGATLGGVVITGTVFLLDPQPWKALVFAVVFIVYQQIENHTLQPWIMGRAVKISTFPVFLMTLAGIQLAGFVGALFAIPVGAAVNVIAQDLLAERRRRAPGAPGDLSTKVA
jgi:predicted PurR-regulated permease PerM